MEKLKRILVLVLEIASLTLLLALLSKGGFATILGSSVLQIVKWMIEFGVSLMGLFGIVVGTYLPTRRHRVFRDTQIHILKYLSVLEIFQLIAMFMTGEIGGFNSKIVEQIPSVMVNVLITMFSLMSVIMPLNYIKGLFTMIKGVEFRNAKDLIRQIFGN